MSRQRKLNENSVYFFGFVQFFYLCDNFFLRYVFGERVKMRNDTCFRAGGYFVSYVYFRSRIVADYNNGKPDLLALFFKFGNFASYLRSYLSRNLFSVDKYHFFSVNSLYTEESMPFTKALLFSVEYFLTSTTASLMDTDKGISSIYFISYIASRSALRSVL